MTRPAGELAVHAEFVDMARLLTVEGVLTSTTYLKLRDLIIKAALDEPRAVLVDVNGLAVPAQSAWSVFTSARWHVSTWPDVPVMLVCTSTAKRRTIERTRVAHYVPVHPTVEAALHALSDDRRPNRRRESAKLPWSPMSLRQTRELVAEWLTVWSQADLIPAATVVINVFVENVLQHTSSDPVIVVETDGTTVTVAVQDASHAPAERREKPAGCDHRVSGLAIVAAVSRAWGSSPTPSGKMVWAVIGPENCL